MHNLLITLWIKGVFEMDTASIWAQMLVLLEKSFTEAVFDSMIKPMTPVSFENNVLTLRTHMEFFKPTIKQRYSFEINRCLRSLLDQQDLEVEIVSSEDLTSSQHKGRKGRGDQYSSSGLRDKYIFETFVKGKCNELAYAAALAVAEAPGKTGYNPLFLYGGVGLGKTHLIHSIGNYVAEQNSSLKILYISTETFTNEFIAAIRMDTTTNFKNKYRDCDLLLIDDIQFLEGKEETQEEMFHTFNTLYNDNKQIVLTSDQPPKELTSLEKRLTSRFSMGLIVDVTIPDYETRAAILDKKLAMEHIRIPSEVKEFIIRSIVSNIRDLEGALNKVTAYARLTNTPITLDLANFALKDQIVGAARPEITVPYIQQIVAAYYNLTVNDLNGRKRTQSIVYPRQIAMYLSRKILDVSLPDVGDFFGGRDHSTVIHSCDKIANELENDGHLRNVVNELERKIKGE
jgi:chromosomal replication initiator protein